MTEEIACNNCGTEEEDLLTKHDEDFWLCSYCDGHDND